MVRAGVPESVAMRISGHQTVAVFKRYDVTSQRDLEAARNLLEASRAHFGHNTGPKVVPLARQITNT